MDTARNILFLVLSEYRKIDYAPITRFFLGEYVKRMRGGVFLPVPNAKKVCEYCDYKTVCRYDEKRIRAKLICRRGETDGP